MKKWALVLVILMGISILPSAVLVEGQFGGGDPLFNMMIGIVYDLDGETPLIGADITITNLNTGNAVSLVQVEPWYDINLTAFPGGVSTGDEIRVEGELGHKYGKNTTIADMDEFIISCDVYTFSGLPAISHTPIGTVVEGDMVLFSAEITDDTGVSGAELRIHKDGDTTVIALEQHDDIWSRNVSIQSLYWPAFNYTINATDGVYNSSTEPYMVWVNDSIPPKIGYTPTPVSEGEDIVVEVIGDERVFAGGNITYLLFWSFPFNTTSRQAVFPGEHVHMPSAIFTVNIWDGNNTVTEEFTVEVLDATPPSPLPYFIATPQDGTLNITLAWGAAQDNIGITGYELNRSIDGIGYENIANLSADTFSYVDSGDNSSHTYYYKIRAIDALDNTGVWSEANATTSDADPPTIAHQGIWEWNETTDMAIDAVILDETSTHSAFLHYDTGVLNTVQMTTSDWENWTAVIPGSDLSPGSITYRIEATDGIHWRQSKTYSVWILDITPPSTLNVNISLKEIEGRVGAFPQLTWTNATDNVQVAEYNWAVQTQPFTNPPIAPYAQASQENGIIYFDAAPGTQYFFAVAAYDGRNMGEWVYVNITTPTVDTTGPVLSHTVPDSAKAGESLMLNTNITDPSGVASADIIYWTIIPGDGGVAPMSLVSGDTWMGIIPFSAIDGSVIRYFFSAADNNGVEARLGSSSLPYSVNISTRTVNASIMPITAAVIVPGGITNMQFAVNTTADASWFFLLALDGAESYDGTIDGQQVDLYNATPIFLSAGEYVLSLALQFPSNYTGTTSGDIHIIQKDAENDQFATIVLLPADGQITPDDDDTGDSTGDDTGGNNKNIAYAAIAVVIVLIVLLALMKMPNKK